LALARLSAQASLVQTYVAIRTAEQQTQVLKQAQTAYERALQLTQYRYDAGVVSAADVAQAQLQVSSTQAQLIEVNSNRTQLLHALDVLLGQAPGQLQLTPSAALPVVPALPDVVPAALLQRRPDVRAAQQRVLSAQANAGAAQAAPARRVLRRVRMGATGLPGHTWRISIVDLCHVCPWPNRSHSR
jgi:outer membrane protein TolC